MHFSNSIVLLALAASTASAAPLGDSHQVVGRDSSNITVSTQSVTQFLQDGFENPSPDVVAEIEEIAGGTLSDAPPPPNPGPDGITNLQFIAFNELFEVSFFGDLLFNITTNVKGYQADDLLKNVPGYPGNADDFREYVIQALIAVLAQEELHVLNANDALAHFNVTPIEPCEYTFPVEDFQSAISLAGLFTDLVLGTLQDVQQIFANANASGLVRGVGSVIGQEGEQEAFYRLLQGKRPSSAAFMTTSVRDFAFTALQSFVVPNSCPNENEIQLKIFGGLNVVNAAELQAQNGTAQFSVNTAQGSISSSSSVVYISGQNLPVTVPIKNFAVKNGIATFEASFPFEGGADGVGAFNDGLTIAAVVSGNTTFSSADAVAKVATFGPGLIEVESDVTVTVVTKKE